MPGRLPTHGQNRRGLTTPEYKAWSEMFQRCGNPNNMRYARYGARGIRVCEKWLKFELFFEDMGLRPSPGHSLERINNDGNYEPENCKWATRKEQARNRRGNRIVEFNGRRATLAEWSELTGINYCCLRQRLCKMGWSVEATLTKPITKPNRLI